MGSVSVQTDSGVMRFQIAGDSPTAIEKSKIQRIVMSERPERKSRIERSQSGQEFDTETGIKNNKLRRQLAGAELLEKKKMFLVVLVLEKAIILEIIVEI